VVFLLSFFLIEYANGKDVKSSVSSGTCGDIGYAGVKKTENFPAYNLPTPKVFPKSEHFIYYPISDINAYDTLLKGNRFTLSQSNDTFKSYNHYYGGLIDIIVVTSKAKDGFFFATITSPGHFKSNQSLLNAVKPANVPLVNYLLIEHYVGERNFVINHFTQYKSDLKKLGFKNITVDGDEIMEREVGNCVYQWFYQHSDHYLNARNGYMNYSWVVLDKTFYSNLKNLF
jgi:hypothetical protein